MLKDDRIARLVRLLTASAASLSLSFGGPQASAEVTRFEVLSRAPRPSGELITARVTIALNPNDRHNRLIADLALAPQNPRGQVEATTDVTIFKPVHPSGAVLVDLPNRGFALGSEYLDHHSPNFLEDRGITVVEAAWQGDAPRGLTFHAPVIQGLTGGSRDTWVMTDADPVKRLSLAYPAAQHPDAHVFVRLRPDAELQASPGLSVRFVDPSTVELTRPASMAKAGSVIEIRYRATDPRVMGMGLAAVRDVTAYLKHSTRPDNPLGDVAHRRFIGFGVSQSGRALRDMLYQGFNEDEAGRQVFDGLMPIIPGARRSFTNARFAQPGRNPGPSADRLYPVDQFPFAYELAVDRQTNRRDGLLALCRSTGTCPKIIEIDSEFEFWGSHASLNVTDPQGAPLAIAPEVRLFLVAGAQHGPDDVSKTLPQCRLETSSVQHSPVSRALLLAMDGWINSHEPPPASRYPSLSDGTLAPADEVYSPLIPGLGYKGRFVKAPRTVQTADGPRVTGWYPLSFPRADVLGDAIAGVRTSAIAAPRATYVGWNPQTTFEGPEDLCTQIGGALALARTEGEAKAHLDPRPSLETLYPSPGAYQAAVQKSTDALVKDRLLLPSDAEAEVRTAQALDPKPTPP